MKRENKQVYIIIVVCGSRIKGDAIDVVNSQASF